MKPHKFKPQRSGDVWCSEMTEANEYCAANAAHPVHTMMTAEQETDLQMIKARFTQRVDQKYRDGAAEHGGNVWDNVSLPELEDEIIDAYVYTQAMRRRLVNLVTLEEIIQRISDPGAFTPRGDDFQEPIITWGARAVMLLLQERMGVNYGQE